MRRLNISLILIISLLCVSLSSYAEDNISQKNISLSLRNIDISEALKFLSSKAGLNIIPTQAVAGRVTLSVENVPLQDVLDIMLRSNNLAYDKVGEIYNIMTEAEYKRLYGKNFSDVRQIKVFRLKYAVPRQAFNILETLKSEIGRIFVDTESGTIMIMDIPEKIQDVEKALEAMEQKSSVRIFTLKYAKAKDIEEQLKAQLDLKNVGYVKVDERANQVIVQTLPERMNDIAELIAGLDKKTKQVLIDTKIIKIKISDELTNGLEWEGLFNVGKNFGMSYLGSYPFSAVQTSSAAWRSRETVLKDVGGSVGSFPFSGTTSDFSASKKQTAGEKLHVGVIDRQRDFDALFKYLQTLGKTKVLSNPTLAVINNHEAKFHVGERQAYVTTSTTTGATTSTVSEQVTYVDVGLQLSITPMINDDGYVIMKIKPEVSSIVGTLTSSTSNVIPIIDTSMAETTVMAKDGSTIIIGGLSKQEKSEDTEQVPSLGKVPLVGALFKSKIQKIQRTELLIMLTPIISEGDMLVTVKDKEDAQGVIKSAKHFDVFKEESKETTAKEEPLVPKGFKRYE